MTYDKLLSRIPPALTIASLGGRTTITILNHGPAGLSVLNSKGRTYRLTRQDWSGAKAIRDSHPRNPWGTVHYTQLNMWYSYSLIHAAALLRHMERQEHTPAPESTLLRFHRKEQNMEAA
jgi:hypothetical protein